MTFTNIAKGAAVFIDANTFVYHFIADPLGATGGLSASVVALNLTVGHIPNK